MLLFTHWGSSSENKFLKHFNFNWFHVTRHTVTHWFSCLALFLLEMWFSKPSVIWTQKVFLKNYSIYNLNIKFSKKTKRLCPHIANLIDAVLTVLSFVCLFYLAFRCSFWVTGSPLFLFPTAHGWPSCWSWHLSPDAAWTTLPSFLCVCLRHLNTMVTQHYCWQLMVSNVVTVIRLHSNTSNKPVASNASW